MHRSSVESAENSSQGSFESFRRSVSASVTFSILVCVSVITTLSLHRYLRHFISDRVSVSAHILCAFAFDYASFSISVSLCAFACVPVYVLSVSVSQKSNPSRVDLFRSAIGG